VSRAQKGAESRDSGKLKILFVNDLAYEAGGSQSYLFRLYEQLQERGHTVRLLASDAGNAPLRADAYFKRINPKLFTRYVQWLCNADATRALRRELATFTPDIVHFNYLYNHASPATLTVARSCPAVVTAHDMVMVCPERYLTRVHPLFMLYLKVRVALFARGLRTVQRVIAPSIFMKRIFESRGVQRVQRIANGTAPMAPVPLPTAPTILFVGGFIEEKGVRYCIEAMPAIVRAIPKARLVLVGYGPIEPSLRALVARYKLGSAVVFAGKKSGAELHAAYASAQIVVVPSIIDDNFPTVCIEALMVGRPVVGTRMGGIPELVSDGKTGFLVPPRDAQALSQRCIQLLSHREVALSFARESVKRSAQYSLAEHVNRIESVYRELLGEHHKQ
jgi:glycosyltransferase involved in cell wall biosynthesis